jgi:hypothetical protein
MSIITDKDRAAAGGGLHSQHPSWDTGQPESGLPTAVSLPVATGAGERVTSCIGHKERESVRVEAMEGDRDLVAGLLRSGRQTGWSGPGRLHSSRIDAPRLSPSPLALQHASKVPPDRDPHRATTWAIEAARRAAWPSVVG